MLKSKAQVTTAEYGATYTLLGPLNKNSVCSLPISLLFSLFDAKAGAYKVLTSHY